jgi:hypothetical protein
MVLKKITGWKPVPRKKLEIDLRLRTPSPSMQNRVGDALGELLFDRMEVLARLGEGYHRHLTLAVAQHRMRDYRGVI